MHGTLEADGLPGRIVLLRLPDRLLGIPLRPPDRLERRAGDRISPDGSRRRRADALAGQKTS